MTERTTVVNIRRDKYDVKVCRKPDNSIPDPPKAGCFGNPFFLRNVNDDVEREWVLKQYREYFYERIKTDKAFLDAVMTLKGKRLACFCAPKKCHADIIAEFLNADLPDNA